MATLPSLMVSLGGIAACFTARSRTISGSSGNLVPGLGANHESGHEMDMAGLVTLFTTS